MSGLTISSRLAVLLSGALLYCGAVPAADINGLRVDFKDIYSREVLYHYYQNDFITALSLPTAVRDGTIATRGLTNTDLLLAQSYISYGLHTDVEEMFRAGTTMTAAPALLARTQLDLARAYYHRGIYKRAEEILSQSDTTLPSDLNEERQVLLGDVLLVQGRLERAVQVLNMLRGESNWTYYGMYNRAIALHRLKRTDEAISSLEALASVFSDDEEVKALRDRANLTLAQIALNDKNHERARAYFEKIPATSVYYEEALLGLGWSRTLAGDHYGSLTSWQKLQKGDVSSARVQQALIAVPFVLGQLGDQVTSLKKNQDAISVYSAQLEAIDEAIKALHEGPLLDKVLALKPESKSGGVKLTGSFLSAPGSKYLVELLARNEFRTASVNYRDLGVLRRSLVGWDRDIKSYGHVLQARKKFDALKQQLDAFHDRIDQLLVEVDSLAEIHKEYIRDLSITSLNQDKDRLRQYLGFARLAVAQGYDSQFIRQESGTPAPAAAEGAIAGSKTNNMERAIENYRIFLGLGIHHPQNGSVIRRLADLEMIKSERAEPGIATKDVSPTASFGQIMELYDTILKANPRGPGNDHVYYQLAKIFDLKGESAKAIEWLEKLGTDYPASIYAEEVHFRLGENYFAKGRYADAEKEYRGVVTKGEFSAFYEKALYKFGWAMYKQGRYDDGIKVFFQLLDRKLGDARTWRVGEKPIELSRGDKELADDIFRAVSLSVSHLDGVNSLAKYFSEMGNRTYQVRAYEALADYYLEKDRVADATETLRTFANLYPGHPQAPFFHLKVMDAYRQAGYKALLLEAKTEFAKANEVGSVAWLSYGPEVQDKIRPRLREIIEELGRYYHATAQKTRDAEAYTAAAGWYQSYVHSFPGEPKTGEINYLLADIYTETGQHELAAQEYDRTAYDYPPHGKAADAAYAGLVSLQRETQGAQGPQQRKVRLAMVDGTIRFAEHFPKDARVPGAMTKATQELFSMDELGRSAEVAERILVLTTPQDTEARREAWTIIAHTAFENKDFPKAESSYQQLLGFVPASDPAYQKTVEQYALSIYRQAEAANAIGDLESAIAHFLRVGQAAPTSSVRVNADFDAANALLAKKDWKGAIAVLEDFRRRYPTHELQENVTTKLAVAYTETNQTDKAAGEFSSISFHGTNPDLQREASWQAVELYQKAGRDAEAITALNTYLNRFPTPLEPATEARHRLADHYKKAGQADEYHRWLQEIIKADKEGGTQRTDRTRYLAASAAYELAAITIEPFNSIKLTMPLKTSLEAKKKAMETALQAFGQAAEYEVADVTPAATYWIASIYEEFGKSLMASERPPELSGEELEQYNVLLEEQAFPFEEKAIEIHEINARRVANGIYNEWVRKSFAGLSKLMPARYSKSEKGELYIEAIN
ncbi:MAG: hypothetical protein FD165_887 [Gammaproteobacteria bacterium]|nr:MAG: hypothetical protein FD165_887 [Gammaproteobacteria bacterium]TND06404.1 MAG: hypothetical protein FD120_891 [Gammaproteobacteria bacterium]